MLRSLKAIEGYAVGADDGDIGKVVNFFLDDERWTIRYLVVETGGPLTWDGRLVLISPISFRQVDWLTRRFHLALTMEWVKNSPSVEMDKPVSRQHETDYTRHYGHMRYWGYPGIWGVGSSPSLLAWQPRFLPHRPRTPPGISTCVAQRRSAGTTSTVATERSAMLKTS